MVASGNASAVAVFNPVNPSIATTCTASRHARGWAASHIVNARDGVGWGLVTLGSGVGAAAAVDRGEDR